MTIFVRDQDRARAFYVDVLGWDLLSDENYTGVDGELLRWLEVRPPHGQTAVTLAAARSSLREVRSQSSLTLRASELETTVIELKRRGVVFTSEITQSPMAKYTHFSDPDGYIWTVQELRLRSTWR
ncbi:MAG TPA: VOC family protein [Candidatus Dormibacteraeota bacterium]